MAVRSKLARYASICCEQVMPVPVIPICTTARRIPKPIHELPVPPPLKTPSEPLFDHPSWAPSPPTPSYPPMQPPMPSYQPMQPPTPSYPPMQYSPPPSPHPILPSSSYLPQSLPSYSSQPIYYPVQQPVTEQPIMQQSMYFLQQPSQEIQQYYQPHELHNNPFHGMPPMLSYDPSYSMLPCEPPNTIYYPTESEEWNPVFLPLPDEPSYPIVLYSPNESSDSSHSPPNSTNYTEQIIHEVSPSRPLALTFSPSEPSRSTEWKHIKILNYPPSEEPTSGMILTNASGITPDGYLPCDGSSCLRSTYPTLFSVIGMMYTDEDDSTTFTIPNLEDPNGEGIFYIIKI